MYQEAIAAYKKAITLSGGSVPFMKAPLAYAYAVSGKKDEAHKILDEMKELWRRGMIRAPLLATIYTGLGEKDLAIE